MEKRALYNSLRLNWLLDPSLKVDQWQVEDYRSLPLEELFQRLSKLGISIDAEKFLALADSIDTPEELAEDQLVDEEEGDQTYLLLFELWRRLVPEKQSLSIFCDELDRQIHLFDKGFVESMEVIEDAIAQLMVLLDENADEGGDPHALFESIRQGCAHNIEEFLYDFIALQLKEDNHAYAIELIEGFMPYVHEPKWFKLLDVEAHAESDLEMSHRLLHQLIKEAHKKPDLEFNIELLSYIARKGDDASFTQLAKQSFALMKVEEDFWDLLECAEEYYHYRDDEQKEKILLDMAERRQSMDPGKPLDRNHPDFKTVAQMLRL